jgi:hypothetical protein
VRCQRENLQAVSIFEPKEKPPSGGFFFGWEFYYANGPMKRGKLAVLPAGYRY